MPLPPPTPYFKRCTEQCIFSLIISHCRFTGSKMGSRFQREMNIAKWGEKEMGRALCTLTPPPVKTMATTLSWLPTPRCGSRVLGCAAIWKRSNWCHCEWDLEKCKLIRIAEENEWEALWLCVTRVQYHSLKDQLAIDGSFKPSDFLWKDISSICSPCPRCIGLNLMLINSLILLKSLWIILSKKKKKDLFLFFREHANYSKKACKYSSNPLCLFNFFFFGRSWKTIIVHFPFLNEIKDQDLKLPQEKWQNIYLQLVLEQKI